MSFLVLISLLILMCSLSSIGESFNILWILPLTALEVLPSTWIWFCCLRSWSFKFSISFESHAFLKLQVLSIFIILVGLSICQLFEISLLLLWRTECILLPLNPIILFQSSERIFEKYIFLIYRSSASVNLSPLREVKSVFSASRSIYWFFDIICCNISVSEALLYSFFSSLYLLTKQTIGLFII